MNPELAITASLRRTYRAATADQACTMYREEFGQQVTVDKSAGQADGECTIDVIQFGPVRIMRHAVAVGMQLRGRRDDLYGLSVGTAGRVTVGIAGRTVSPRGTAAVATCPASGPLAVDAAADSGLDSVVIERWALDRQLANLLDRPVRRGIPFAPEVDLANGPGRGLWRIMRLFADALGEPDSAVFRPIVAAPLCQALLDGFLLTADHPYRDALSGPVPACHLRPVKRAVDAIHAQPEHPFTSASLARLAAVSTRTLQAGFRQHLDTSPMAYLRMVRLARAHGDLVTGRAHTVAEAAHRWGFTHLGRFAGLYRRVYGAPPSVTRRPA